MNVYAGVLADLTAEYSDLDGIVAAIDDAAWDLPTPAPGWTIGDQVRHIAFADERALEAVTDPEGFTSRTVDWSLGPSRSLGPREVMEWWRSARAALVGALASAEPSRRVPWYGPPMGMVSFASARLMETWAHGQDVVDTLGVVRAPTPRLRHVAHLGVTARPWSFTVHGLDVPREDVRVELHGPDGATWEWGDEGAENVVRGDALDFCFVVTQRRHPDDVHLDVSGPVPAQWVAVAQAFAGPPGAGRSPGQFAP